MCFEPGLYHRGPSGVTGAVRDPMPLRRRFRPRWREFGDYRVNWKLEALIHVRDSEEKLRGVYRGTEQPDPSWVQLREYTCPGCGAQLEVEAVPRGCRPDFEFLPDLGTFYRDWLRRSLPGAEESVDKTLEVIGGWST